MEIEEVKKEIVKIIKKELMKESQSVANLSVISGFSAFFFGSRVKCESIPTLYKIDIVDFAFISEDFKKVTKLKIEKIV